MPVNTKPQTVNFSLAWALFSTNLSCNTGLEPRSYDSMKTDTEVIPSLTSQVRERLSDLVGVHALIAAVSVAQSILGATCDLMTDTRFAAVIDAALHPQQVTENAVQVFSRSAHFPPNASPYPNVACGTLKMWATTQ